MDEQDKHCIPCEEGAEPFTEAEAERELASLSGWEILEGTAIGKRYTFHDFRDALSFVNEVGDLAEYEGHHPDLNLHNWNKVDVTLSTHAVKGLSENDFVMAKLIDRAFSERAE